MFINKNYFLIWSGKFVSMIGDRFYTLVLALWVLERSQSPMMMGVVLVASTLPAFIIGFFSGTYVDMKNKKYIVVATDLLRGGLILSVAYFEYSGILNIQIIIFISVIISVLNAFFEPAIKALIPEVVEEEDLARANGMEQLISGISSVIGPILGAVALGAIGFFGGFLINGISFIMSAFFETFIYVVHEKREEKGENHFFKNMKEGFSYVLKKESLKKILMIIAIVHFAVGSFSLILPFLAEAISKNTMNLGLLQGFLGIGLIIGATILNMAKRKEHSLSLLIIYIGILSITYGGVAILRYMDVNSLVLYLAVVLIMGITISNSATYWQLILQLETPEELRGRVFSLVSVIANVSFPISFGLIGVLLEFVDFEFYLLGISLIMILLSAFWRKY